MEFTPDSSEFRELDHLVATGAAVVLATHEIEPFVGQAVRALAVCDGAWRIVEPLPAEPRQRLAVLDALTRGVGPGDAPRQ